jgi:hypothetical protein
MWAYLNRKNLILTAISALILLYFSAIALLAYLVILLAVGVGCHWGSANRFAKMTNFITNTTLLIVTFLVLAMLLEIGLHLKPHFFTGNSPDILGEFSDFTSRGQLTEEVFQKPKGVFRILGLGDSFAVNLAYWKKNYHDFLREKLSGLGRSRVEVVNAGMPGVGPGYFWQILHTYGERLRPDLVMVGFFEGHDFEDWKMVITIGNVISEPKDLREKIWNYLQVEKTRLGSFISRKLMFYNSERKRAQEAQALGFRDGGSFSRETFLEIERKRCRIFQRNGRVELQRNWRQCARVLAQIKQWCEARRVELVLLIFPDQFQVDEDLRAQVLEKYQIPADSLDLEYPNTLITDFCRQNQIHCLDLLPPFQEKEKTTQLYRLRDTHWNEAGNRLAAELIFNYLEDHKLIKVD